ncbi:MAG: DUF4032 domain-containing protein [Pseudonocardiales bacterium]|nr:MAG: DUF4032 domain-containing protein [Pseudonocardiales bacterium]
MSTYRLTTHGTNTDLLDLPYGQPLAEWDESLIVHVPRGISRHIVRFVEADGEIFALKEATDRFVLREHSLLRLLADRSVPVVDAYGTVVERTADDGGELPGLLLTKHLTFSLPYRSLFTGRGLPALSDRLLDALAELFVRIHLAGFYWGDCSLSNTLFRRDAGALAAYLVDAETGEVHPSLSDGQRANDLAIATENIAGEMFDLEAAGYLAESIDPIKTAMALTPRYERLWDELNRDEVVERDESYRINNRVRRLNSLGFDVAEMAIRTEQDGRKLRFETQVVEPGHHQRSLFRLTGLRVQENEARALLADIARFRAKWEEGRGETVSEEAAARRWLNEKYHATLDLVPPDERAKMPDAELFHEINEHRWFLSEARGNDVGRAAAVTSYVDAVLHFLPDTALDLTSGPPTEEFEPIFD